MLEWITDILGELIAALLAAGLVGSITFYLGQRRVTLKELRELRKMVYELKNTYESEKMESEELHKDLRGAIGELAKLIVTDDKNGGRKKQLDIILKLTNMF